MSSQLAVTQVDPSEVDITLLDHPMYLSMFQKKSTAFTNANNCGELTLGELINVLSKSFELTGKEHAVLYNFWRFDPRGRPGRFYHYDANGNRLDTFDEVPDTVGRCAANAIETYALALDCDGGVTIQEMQTMFKDWFYIICTSFNHSPKLHKFRLIVPFNKPMSLMQFKGYADSLKQQFNCDPTSFSETQAFYFPSHAKGNPWFFDFQVKSLFDWQNQLTYVPPKKAKLINRANYKPPTKEKQRKVLDALMTCSDLHYGSAIILGQICNRFDLSQQDFDMICQTIDGGQSLHNACNRSGCWREAVKRGKATDLTMYRFLKNHNGYMG